MKSLTDRLPPHDPEMEACVLGSILLDPRLIGLVVQQLSGGSESFYDMRHRLIYDTMIGLWNDQKPVDLSMVSNRLKAQKFLEEVGGVNYIGCLPDAVPSVQNLPSYIEEINHKWLARKMIRICSDFSVRAYEANGNTETLFGEFQNEVSRLIPAANVGQKTVAEEVDEAFEWIEQCILKKGENGLIRTGLCDLDRIFNGFEPSSVTIIGGFPGTGKTALAMNIVEHAALIQKQPVGVISLEMSATSLWVRMFCSQSRVSQSAVKKGTVDQSELNSFVKTRALLRNCSVYTRAEGPISTDVLSALAHTWVAQKQIKLLVVDYLQLVQCSKGCESRQQEVAAISECIKHISTRLDLPVIALSQLNDDGKLRESRAIGQDADNVWLLEDDDEVGGSLSAPVALRITKYRNGEIGTVKLVFLKHYTRFECPTHELPIPSRNNPYND